MSDGENQNTTNTQTADRIKNTDNVVLSIKLDGHNYALWARLMRVAVGGRGAFKHLTGSPPPPSPEDPRFPQWEETDLVVFSWILNNMENKLVANFAHHQTAKAVWDSLAMTYGGGPDPLQTYDLEVKANKISQGGETLEEYWNRLQTIWVHIDRNQPKPITCCEEGINQYRQIVSSRRLLQFLSGLNERYSGIRREILKESPNPSVELAFGWIQREATRIHIWEPATKLSSGDSLTSSGGEELSSDMDSESGKEDRNWRRIAIKPPRRRHASTPASHRTRRWTSQNCGVPTAENRGTRRKIVSTSSDSRSGGRTTLEDLKPRENRL